MSDARWTHSEMMDRAAHGVGLVDYWGPRGATLVSQEQIEAMAGALAVFGLRPILPPSAGASGAPPDTPSLSPIGAGMALPLLGPGDV